MNITVYLGASFGHQSFWKDAVQDLGHWIGSHSHQLIYGGSRAGLMGELAESVLQSGGRVTGVEPQFFIDAYLQLDGIDELIVVPDMSTRKAKMIELGDAFIAFPGGTGTLEEISEIMSAVCIGLMDKPCIIYNLNHYYDHLKALLDHMLEEGFVRQDAYGLIHFVTGLDEIEQLLSCPAPI